MQKMSLEEFRESGLLLLTNQFLHIFGVTLSITQESDGSLHSLEVMKNIDFRGFVHEKQELAYSRIHSWVQNNLKGEL